MGRAGDDPAGDALMLALASAGIGHVAVLRDVAATPVLPPLAVPDDEAAEDIEAAVAGETTEADPDPHAESRTGPGSTRATSRSPCATCPPSACSW